MRKPIKVTDFSTREPVQIFHKEIHRVSSVSDTERARITFSGKDCLDTIVTVETYEEVTDLLLEDLE